MYGPDGMGTSGIPGLRLQISAVFCASFDSVSETVTMDHPHQFFGVTVSISHLPVICPVVNKLVLNTTPFTSPQTPAGLVGGCGRTRLTPTRRRHAWCRTSAYPCRIKISPPRAGSVRNARSSAALVPSASGGRDEPAHVCASRSTAAAEAMRGPVIVNATSALFRRPSPCGENRRRTKSAAQRARFRERNTGPH